VLLDINKIVQIIHDTYQHSYFKARPYSTLDDWALGDGRASGARRDNHDSDSHAEIPVGINVCLDVLSSHVSTPGFLRQLRSPDTPSVTPEVCSSDAYVQIGRMNVRNEGGMRQYRFIIRRVTSTYSYICGHGDQHCPSLDPEAGLIHIGCWSVHR
jgi:hypothetical protein